jgi:hydrogenase maturation protease
MSTLLIAAGNPLRRDDGVAHRVLELLSPVLGAQTESRLQFTPELAQEIAGFDTVVFIDADAEANAVSIEPIETPHVTPVLSHASRPADIVAIARALFHFDGQALVCRVPACDLSPGEGLSHRAATLAVQAAQAVHDFISSCALELAPQAKAETLRR